jgi:hypothetical protein
MVLIMLHKILIGDELKLGFAEESDYIETTQTKVKT